MADDPSLRGVSDRSRVNVNQPHELRSWCTKFGCTEDQLKAAVARVGVMATDVERFLKTQSSPSADPGR
jgi:hypothetical protein